MQELREQIRDMICTGNLHGIQCEDQTNSLTSTSIHDTEELVS